VGQPFDGILDGSLATSRTRVDAPDQLGLIAFSKDFAEQKCPNGEGDRHGMRAMRDRRRAELGNKGICSSWSPRLHAFLRRPRLVEEVRLAFLSVCCFRGVKRSGDTVRRFPVRPPHAGAFAPRSHVRPL